VQAAVISAPGHVEVGEVPDPAPAPDEVVVAVRACGICGTDVHIAEGDFSLACYPVVPGHEFAGEVVAAGSQVEGVGLGTLVTADPNCHCGRCRLCREGHGNLCENLVALGVTVPGGCAEFVALPYWLARRLPEGFDASVGALIEPLSCVVHGYDLLRPKLGDRFCVYGTGTMGLMLVMLARRVGAIEVAVVEPKAERRQLALSLGADRAVAGGEELGGERFGVVIDASGALRAIEEGLSHVAPGGTFHQFGVAPDGSMARFSPYRLYNCEQSFVGSMAVGYSFDRACDLATGVELGLDRLLGDVVPLASYEEALERVRKGEGLKVQVAPARKE
jgi:2-desacetyl-2-hydroxyethyl bacteriochlorophyllide A dehydrogenase